MDQLVHLIVGTSLGEQETFRKSIPRAWLWGIFLNNAPDLDVVLVVHDRLTYLTYHRTFTHAISGILILPMVLGFLLPRKWIGNRRIFIHFAILNFAIHTLLDLTSSWPTYLLWPFSHRQFALDWQFILAPPVWFIGCIAFLTGLKFQKQKKELALLVLIFTSFYFIHGGGTHARAQKELLAHLNPTLSNQGKIRVLPLPFRHDHRYAYARTSERLYRWYQPHRRGTWNQLPSLDLSVCPNPSMFSQFNALTRAFFHFAREWGCIQLDKAGTTFVFFHAKYFFYGIPPFTLGPVTRQNDRIHFGILVKFDTSTGRVLEVNDLSSTQFRLSSLYNEIRDEESL